MTEEIMAYMCSNFQQYDEYIFSEDANLVFGDGKCPVHNFIINSNNKCPSDCKLYEEVE